MSKRVETGGMVGSCMIEERLSMMIFINSLFELTDLTRYFLLRFVSLTFIVFSLAFICISVLEVFSGAL